MTEFYQHISEETTQQLRVKINSIQSNFNSIQNGMNQFVDYVKEKNLQIPTNGTYQQQINTCETLIDRMKEIVQQKDDLNKKKEILLKSIEELFETAQCDKEKVENYHDKIVFKMMEIEENKYKMMINELNEQKK